MLCFQVIDEHKESLDPENPRDLVDSFLLEMEKPGFQELFQDRDPMTQLQQVVLDLFSAGVETLKTSLLWSVVYMLHNPEVLAKVQAELDSIVGPDRLPEMADMERLPYTRATLYEVMRRSSVVPMGTTHATHRYVFSLFWNSLNTGFLGFRPHNSDGILANSSQTVFN